MSDSVTTDVFKFVAVRPAQLAQDSDTRMGFIRDKRALTEDGLHDLANIARPLSAQDTALERWRGLDLSRISDLAGRHRELRRNFEAPAAGEALPDPGEVLAEVGWDDLAGIQDRLAGQAFDALYTAYATG